MPTYDLTDTFKKDLSVLDAEDRRRFHTAVQAFIEDLSATDHGFRAGLRVKRVQATKDVWEMTWAPDGRATFEYGAELRVGELHVVWRWIGTHDIFSRP
ncbi:MAG: hypothetical protein QM747_08710 [Nocardioides sp.]